MRRRLVVSLLLFAMTVPAQVPVAAASAAPAPPVAPDLLKPVHGTEAPARPIPPNPDADRLQQGTPKVIWPAAGSGEALLAATARSAAPVRIGSLPVHVARTAETSTDPAGRAATQSRVSVALRGREQAASAGADLLLEVKSLDGTTTKLAMTIDYSKFRNAYGGDWAARLRLTKLDGDTRTEVRGTNDVAAGRLTVPVTAAPEATTFAVTADPKGSTGDFTATSLSPTGEWKVGAQTGSFNWEYPMKPSAVPGDLVPELTAHYGSSGVDGRVASANGQTSWLGEGWDLSPGFVERRYVGCVEDTLNGPPTAEEKTGDLCWAGENATFSLGHKSSDLVKIADRVWKLKDDDGSKIEQLFDTSNGSINGDDNGEYWRYTSTTGVQYYFGRNRLPGWQNGGAVTNSAWTVPVYGNDAGEPCASGTFATSVCRQAYRWNLDYVVDTRGNAMKLSYAVEHNKYGRNMGKSTDSYVRGGTLTQVDYGFRAGEEFADKAQARVLFGLSDRCLPGADCTKRVKESWPDVPWDQNCEGDTCPERFSPTFWSTKRLTSVTTQVRAGGAFQPVQRWSFEHTYPSTGDGTTAALWLRSITKTGLAATDNSAEAVTPPVTFDAVAKPNRVNTPQDGLPAVYKNRIGAINLESGGKIGVVYKPYDCVAGQFPARDTNGTRCFPVRWAYTGAAPTDDWFAVWAVDYVSEIDGIGGAPTKFTLYDQEGPAAWAYNDDPLTPEKYRTWSRWRGYETVQVRRGDPNNPGYPTLSAVRYQYHRGMNGDKTATGIRTVRITDSRGVEVNDDPQLAGKVREEITYNGPGGAEVSATITDYWSKQTGTQGNKKAFVVAPSATSGRVALAGREPRRSEKRTAYNDFGLPLTIDDAGDLAVATDDKCVTTTYARNDGNWVVSLPSRVETIGVRCGATASFPRDAISDVRTYYDDRNAGEVVAGNPTRTEELKSHNGTPAYRTTARRSYDAYGRVARTWDALNRETTKRFEPATGLPTKAVDTNPNGDDTTTTLDPRWNTPTKVVDPNGKFTEVAYDPLGRVTEVWQPDRGRARGQGPTERYRHDLRRDGASSVSTMKLRANGNYTTTYTLYDGLLRERQKQEPSPQRGPTGKGRKVSDTMYDTRGLAFKTNSAYFNEQADPGGNLLVVPDNGVPTQNVRDFDGAERMTRDTYEKFNQPQWSSETRYAGDATTLIPPPGGTPTTQFTDLAGNVTEIREYTDSTLANFVTTKKTYANAGKLASITDAAGNVWRYRYDLAGNTVETTDPDKGTTTSTYDDAGQLTTSTDAERRTVAYTYDVLGRKTETREGSSLLAKWTYDEVQKGQLSSTTRYAGGLEYVNRTSKFDDAYRPTEVQTVIPAGAATGGLAKTYTVTTTYLADGSVGTVGLPAMGAAPASGGLPAETLLYEYNDVGLPEKLTSSQGQYVTHAIYTALGELTQLQQGVQGKLAWQTLYFDEGTRRLAQRATHREDSASLTVDNVEVTHDPAGNIIQQLTKTAGAAADLQCFRYDGLRRLTEAWTTTATNCAGAPGTAVGGPAPYWHSYRTDEIGRRKSQTQHGIGGAADTTSTLTYPAVGAPQPHAPRSLTVSGPAAARMAAGEYDHDQNGNTTSRPAAASTQTYAWDAEGQLASVTANGKTTSYVNTPDNNRLLSSGPDTATVYLEANELKLTRSTGVVTGTRHYTLGDRLIAARAAGKVSYLSVDGQGTADVSVDAGTLAASKRRIDPFGLPRGQQPAAWPGQRGFVGGTTDSSGLTRLGVRDYDPATGQFLTADPLLLSDTPQHLNAYAYSFNNPTTFSDPDGKSPCDIHPTGSANAAERAMRDCDEWERKLAHTGSANAAERATRDRASGQTRNRWLRDIARGRRISQAKHQLATRFPKKREKVLNLNVEDPLKLFSSVSVCVEVSGKLLIGFGSGYCVNIDDVGMSTSSGWKVGWTNGQNGAFSAEVVVKLNSDSAADVGGGVSLSRTATIDVGVYSVGSTVEEDLNNREIDSSTQVGRDIKFRGNTGNQEMMINVGRNDGYDSRWGEIDFPDDGGVCNWNVC